MKHFSDIWKVWRNFPLRATSGPDWHQWMWHGGVRGWSTTETGEIFLKYQNIFTTKLSSDCLLLEGWESRTTFAQWKCSPRPLASGTICRPRWRRLTAGVRLVLVTSIIKLLRQLLFLSVFCLLLTRDISYKVQFSLFPNSLYCNFSFSSVLIFFWLNNNF